MPVWLDHVVLKAVALDLSQRFETAEELVLALERGASRQLGVPQATPLVVRDPTALWNWSWKYVGRKLARPMKPPEVEGFADEGRHRAVQHPGGEAEVEIEEGREQRRPVARPQKYLEIRQGALQAKCAARSGLGGTRVLTAS